MFKKALSAAATSGLAIATVAAIGAGAIYGVQLLGGHLAYENAQKSTIAHIGESASGVYLNTKGSFLLGVADQAGAKIGKHHAFILESTGNSPDDVYFTAGQKWQMEHKITVDAALGMLQDFAGEIHELKQFGHIDFSDELRALGASSPYYLGNTALLRGIIKAADGLIEVDQRTIDRIDEILADQPRAVTRRLDAVTEKAMERFGSVGEGNKLLWAELQNVIHRGPADHYSSRAVPQGVSPSSSIEIIETSMMDINDVVDPFAMPTNDLELARPGG